MRKLFLLLVIFVLLVAGCGSQPAGTGKQGGKLKVVASFYPMGEFARQVGGEHVTVTTLIPDGVEPHEWEPTAKDLSGIKDAGLFVYNGGVEPWAPKAIDAIGADKVRALEAGAGHLELNGHPDPHLWLSPKQAQIEVNAIRDGLIKADAAHKDAYTANAAAYNAKLHKLDQQLAALAKTAKRKEFVTTHAAFGHLAADYGLKQLSILGISPEAEPSPAQLTQLVNLVQEKNIKYVFFETLVSPKVAQTLAAETKAQTLVLNPLEGLTKEERAAGADYLSIMEQNIKNLQLALNS
jgi:zinc transport system substrate-binding protein